MDQVTLRAYAAHASEIARRHASARGAEGGVPRYIARAFAPNDRILDIGAGAGFDLAFLVSEGHQAYGMEPVAEMRAEAVRAHPELSGGNAGQPYYMLDMGIAMEHMVLAAAEQGLGTCWIGGQFDEATVKAALGVPDDVRVVALLPIGYPAEAPGPKDRKPKDAVVSHETW